MGHMGQSIGKLSLPRPIGPIGPIGPISPIRPIGPFGPIRLQNKNTNIH